MNSELLVRIVKVYTMEHSYLRYLNSLLTETNGKPPWLSV